MSDSWVAIGIDPSSVKLAVCAATSEAPQRPIMFKQVLGKRSGPDTSHAAFCAVEEFVGQLGPSPLVTTRLACVEAPVVGKGGIRSTMVQAFTNGAIQAALIDSGFQVILVVNTTWKKEVCGRGNADKRDIAATLRRRWRQGHLMAGGRRSRGSGRIATPDQDLVDAACLNLYCQRIIVRSGQLGLASSS